MTLKIYNSYSIGFVFADSAQTFRTAGGLVGNGSYTATNCFTSSVVSSTRGLYGSFHAMWGGTFSGVGNYYNSNLTASQTVNNNGVTGKTTQQLKTKETFSCII